MSAATTSSDASNMTPKSLNLTPDRSRTPSSDWKPPGPETKPPPPIDPSNLPSGKKSLSGISIRAFLLGLVLGLSISLSLFLAISLNPNPNPHPLWRAPFFLASLAVFHFLEYYTTARYNPAYGSISAFLFSMNGAAYNIAHGSAMVECILAHVLLPEAYFENSAILFGGVRGQLIVGLIFMLVGQTVRTVGMIQAGSNFNHVVQVERREGHMLVQDGIYRFFRHPSYFGFFWWGLGTQLVLGNNICFLGYAVVLWKFFSSRIRKEERFLVKFFGDAYVEYSQKSWVGIPGIS